MKRVLAALVLTSGLFITGCTTVTIHPDKMSKLSTPADFQQSKNFFFFGLVGEHEVNVNGTCGQRGIRQMQTQARFRDSALTIVTLGIYAPHTVKIWCNK